jgi:GT2 family glycosyltransferase
MIYICIPVFNRVAYTRKCIQNIYKQTYKEYSIIICDDASTDGTYEIISSEFPDVVLIKGNGNLWWSGGTNKCVEYALARATPNDYIFTLNNDTEIANDALQVLIDFSKDNPNSIVACGNYFYNDKNKLEGTAFVARNKWPFSLYHRLLFPWGQDVTKLERRIYEINSVAGKGVLIPVEVFRKIGLYNYEKLPKAHGDTEFSRRAVNSGYKIFLNLNAINYTDQYASGIGQINSEYSPKEFIQSFFTKRSENYIPALYHRSRLVYGWKWLIYLIPNIISLKIKFIIRYFKFLITNKKDV